MHKRRVLDSEAARKYELAVASVNFDDPMQRRALAETIVKEVREDIEKDDLISAMGVDTLYFEEGQTVQFQTRYGCKAYVHEPGSYAPRSTITTHTVSIATELVSVHPQLEIGQVRRYGSFEDIRNMAQEEMLGRQYATIWSTVYGSITSADEGTTSSGNKNYWTVASTAAANVKKAAVDSGFNFVADVQGSRITAIVGRRSAFGWLQDPVAWSSTYGPSEDTKKAIDFAPYQAQYRGVPVIMLNQYKDGYGVDRITNGEIMILGSNSIKMGVDRPLGVKEEINVDDLMWHLHMYMKYGVAVLYPERNARIHIS